MSIRTYTGVNPDIGAVPYVPAAAPTNITPPAVTPTSGIVVTTVLTTTDGTWANSPSGYTYQWKRDGANISGATANTYTVQTADANHGVKCTVTATNGSGVTTADSNTVSVPGPPVNTAVPGIYGNTTSGSVLLALNGNWSNTPTSYAYQWKRDGSNISGATSQTYTIVSGDLGHLLTCTVTATNGFGSASATSQSVSIPPLAVGAGPSILGVEIVEFPEISVVAANDQPAVADFTPVLYPLNPNGLSSFVVTAGRTDIGVGTTGAFSLALYSFSPSGIGQFTANLIAYTNAGSITSAGVKTQDFNGAPLTLDFTQNRYLIGIMTSGTPQLKGADLNNNGFGIVKFAAARVSIVDWPTNFSHTAVAGFDSYLYASLVSAVGKNYI